MIAYSIKITVRGIKCFHPYKVDGPAVDPRHIYIRAKEKRKDNIGA